MHIVFFAPYAEASPTIAQVFAERPDKDTMTYEILLDSFNNTLESVKGDAIISRGFTAHTMQKLDIPNAELKTTGYDVIAAVEKCLRQYPYKKIAIVGAFNMVYGSESIGCVYPSVEIRSYDVFEETLLERMVVHAIENGAQAIVGGCSTVDMAKKYSMPAALIECGKEAINNAIDDALRALEITRREKRKSSEIANIMNYSFQGIISTDSCGVITFANNYCAKLLSNRQGIMSGQPAATFFPSIPFDAVIQEGRKILSEIHRIHDHLLMVNCVPVNGPENNTGCVLTFQDVTQIQEEEGKIRKRIYKKGFVAKYHFDNILFQDEVMRETIRIASDFSDSNSNLLILGDTGTGKELFAQSIHNASRRCHEPFVAINCAALPEELLESELFGYVEGAFTGAAKGGKTGLFEIAHKGTIFLDEIGDISAKLQGRLLRVLQEREIIRLGHDAVIPIDVRIISATNKNLREEVEKGVFRQDLLYRLDVLELNIPALRSRPGDICRLIDHYIHMEREKTGCVLKGLDAQARTIALAHSWPGNVRELRNFCERICVLCRREYAEAVDLYEALPAVTRLSVASMPKHENVSNILWENQKQVILEALRLNGGNRGRTATYLRMNKSTLWRKIKKYGIDDTFSGKTL